MNVSIGLCFSISVQVTATDADIDRPNNIQYSLSGSYSDRFQIDPTSGIIHWQQQPNVETHPHNLIHRFCLRKMENVQFIVRVCCNKVTIKYKHIMHITTHIICIVLHTYA